MKRNKRSDRDARAADPAGADAQLKLGSVLPAIIATSWIVVVLVANRDMLSLTIRAALSFFPFVQQLGWPSFDFLVPIVLVFGFLIAALAIGRVAFQPFAFAGLGLEEELVFSLGLGLGLISLAAFSLGLLGHFTVGTLRYGLAVNGHRNCPPCGIRKCHPSDVVLAVAV